MDDRELLELAAKSTGRYFPKKSTPWEGVDARGVYKDSSEDGRAPVYWNPLTDDGDALRLAAALRLQILPGKHHGDGCSVNPTNHSTPGVTSFVESKDMAEQMRRAITWAAAEIGKTMQEDS